MSHNKERKINSQPQRQKSTIISTHCTTLIIRNCSWRAVEEQENLLHCPVVCHCFLSLFLLLSINQMTSSLSSQYSHKHNNCPGPAYPAVPLASVLCINICLHQWLYCADREAEREEEYAPSSACAIVFCSSETAGGAVTLWSTSQLGSTHSALNVLPLSNHAPLCPISLLLSLAALRFCHFLLLIFSSLLRPPRVSFLFLNIHRADLLSASIRCPPFLYLRHEDSAPAEVDELSKPQRAREE